MMKHAISVILIGLALVLVEIPFTTASQETNEEWYREHIDPVTNQKMIVLTETGYSTNQKHDHSTTVQAADDNLLPNPSFEDGTGNDPNGWCREGFTNDYGNYVWDEESSYTGEKSIALTHLDDTSKYPRWMTEDFIPFTWSTHYDCDLSVMHKCNKIPIGENQNGAISFHCYDDEYDYLIGFIHLFWGEYQTEWTLFSQDLSIWYDFLQESQQNIWDNTKYVKIGLVLDDLMYDTELDPSFMIWFDEVSFTKTVDITPEKPTGPETGETEETLTFSVVTGDPLDQQVYYKWDWDDGTQSEWLGPFDSNQQISTEKTFSEEGIYCIRAKAKNTDGIESDWSEAIIVGIPVKNNGEDQVQDDSETGYGNWGGSYAQSFKPTQETLTQISLKTFKEGNPGDLWISIRKELDGDDLAVVEFSSDDIASDKWTWIIIDFDDIAVTPGETYYILWYSLDCDRNNLIYWGLASDNPYPDGNAWEGYPWQEFNPPDYQNPDFCFKTFFAKQKNNRNLFQEFLYTYLQRFPLLQRYINL